MVMKKLSILLVALTSMLGTAAHSESLHLDAQQIASLFPGQYMAKVKGYKIQFSGDHTGKLEGQAFGREDRGTWFIQGNSLCVSWRQWTKGQAQCGAISQEGSWLVASNEHGEMLRFPPGN